MSRSSAWLRHFGFSIAPFDKDVDDSDLWLPSSKDEVVDRLLGAVHERQHILLNLVRLHSHLDYVSPVEFETNAPN